MKTYILLEEPDTVSALGATKIRDLMRDLRIKMLAFEEAAAVNDETIIKLEDDQGYIVKLTQHNPLFSYTSVFDFEECCFNTEEFLGHIDKTATPCYT